MWEKYVSKWGLKTHQMKHNVNTVGIVIYEKRYNWSLILDL